MLFDGDAAQFPLAHVYDSTDAEITGSPFSLTHMALGLYKFSAPVQPADVYDVAYIVYSDSGHTTESTAHDRVSDEIDVRGDAQSSVEDNVVLVDESEEEILLVEECDD